MEKLLKSPEKKSGLGKQLVEMMARELGSILITWVLKKVRRGARRL